MAQQASAGGGTRFLRPLVRALIENYPDMHITVLINAYSADKFGAAAGFDHDRVEIATVDPILCTLPVNPPTTLWGKLRNLASVARGRDQVTLLRKASEEIARRTAEFDLLYLSWPYFLEPFAVAMPVVGTFHDFNFKHDFGTLGPDFVSQLERQVPYWISTSDVVVASSTFIGEEISTHYGEIAPDIRVIRLSTLLSGEPETQEVRAAIAAHGIPDDYVICPSNVAPHKNLSALLRAYSQVRSSGGPPLVLIGSGTDVLSRGASSGIAPANVPHLIDAFDDSGLVIGQDLFALGYVSDQAADALIAGARLLVAPSLYEAGSGPGLDAWALETPVAMSAIPPFEEHLAFLGVEADLFDPSQPDDIARTILAALGDDSRLHLMASRSREAMDHYTWSDVAMGYREAFESAIAAHPRS